LYISRDSLLGFDTVQVRELTPTESRGVKT